MLVGEVEEETKQNESFQEIKNYNIVGRIIWPRDKDKMCIFVLFFKIWFV